MSNLLTRIQRYKRFTPAKRRSEATDLYNTLLRSGTPELAHAFAMVLAVGKVEVNEVNEAFDHEPDNMLLESTTGTGSDIMNRLVSMFEFVGLKPEVNDLTISATSEASSLIHQLVKVIDPNKYELQIQVLTLEGREADRIVVRGSNSKEIAIRMLAQHTGTPYLYSAKIKITPEQLFEV